MNEYENIYILRGSLTEEQARKEIENIKQYFKDVEIFEKDDDMNGYLGLKKLAYKIREEESGYFYLTHFKGTEKETPEIERKLRVNDNVIKFITIRI